MVTEASSSHLSEREMFGREIVEFMHTFPEAKNNFLGVFACDSIIPKLHLHQGIIVNTSKETEKGTLIR